jgi:hypothetical protein
VHGLHLIFLERRAIALRRKHSCGSPLRHLKITALRCAIPYSATGILGRLPLVSVLGKMGGN